MSSKENYSSRSYVIDTSRSARSKKMRLSEDSLPAIRNLSTTSIDQNRSQNTSALIKSATDSKIKAKLVLARGSSMGRFVPLKKRADNEPDPSLQSIVDNDVSSTHREDKAAVFERLSIKDYNTILKDIIKIKQSLRNINFYEEQNHSIVLKLLRVLFDKSRKIRGLLAEKELIEADVLESLIKDTHFMACFRGLLTQMQLTGEITRELKFITKDTLIKLEKFTVEKLEARFKDILVDDTIKERIKKAERLTQTRLIILRRKLYESKF